MTADDPYTGVNGEQVVNYQAGAVEQRIPHLDTADPPRTPTYTVFPKPDFYFATSGPNVSVHGRYAWNHGYYSPNTDITWAAVAGPGVAARGVDGPSPAGTAALAGGSAGHDEAFQREQWLLTRLAEERDRLARETKARLAEAADGRLPAFGALRSTQARAEALLDRAHRLSVR